MGVDGPLAEYPSTHEVGERAHRQVDQENPTPTADGDQGRTQGGTRRYRQRANAAPQRHDLGAALVGIDRQQEAERRGQHRGRSRTLDYPSGNEERNGRSQGAQRRTEAKNTQPEVEDLAATNSVGRATGDY
jgi:hypothetical protein